MSNAAYVKYQNLNNIYIHFFNIPVYGIANFISRVLAGAHSASLLARLLRNMKLLHTQTYRLDEFFDSDYPTYAILSHTWRSSDALSSSHLAYDPRLDRCLPVHEKVIQACQKADSHGIHHLWVDSLCIDASSTADIDEAVNGSFRWLRKSALCLAYLDDLPADGSVLGENTWRHCRYWSRAWTLQELIAPPRVEFFDANWQHRGSKTSPELLPILTNITGITSRVLLDCDTLFDISLAVRMSWAAERNAGREEDTSYSLIGISGVAMSVRYGEGAEQAFLRLQQKILLDTRDGSILAWRSIDKQDIRGLLARSPSEFRHFATGPATTQQSPWSFDGKVRFSSKGIEMQSYASQLGPNILMEIGRFRRDGGRSEKVGVYFREWNGIYVRVNPASTVNLSGIAGSFHSIHVARDINFQTSLRIKAQFAVEETSQLTFPAEPEYKSSTQSRPGEYLSGVSPLFTLAGMKRDPLEHPQSPTSEHRPALHQFIAPDTRDARHDETASCSDSGSDSYEDLESDDDYLLHEDNVQQNTIHPDHEYQSVRAGLVLSCYDKAEKWIASARYIAPPENRHSSYNPIITRDWKSRPIYLQEEDSDDPRLVIVSPIDGYFHLACPFYAFDPVQNLQCLLKEDLRTIKDVMAHLRHHHMRPPYCPTCCQTFRKMIDRDEHIRARSCKLQKLIKIEGINQHQKAKLSRRDNPRLSEEKRWLRLFSTIFPGAKSNPSPYLKDGIGLVVSLLRDYWSSNGQQCVSEYLSDRGLLRRDGPDEDSALAALHSLTLADLLEKFLHEQQAQVGEQPAQEEGEVEGKVT